MKEGIWEPSLLNARLVRFKLYDFRRVDKPGKVLQNKLVLLRFCPEGSGLWICSEERDEVEERCASLRIVVGTKTGLSEREWVSVRACMAKKLRMRHGGVGEDVELVSPQGEESTLRAWLGDSMDGTDTSTCFLGSIEDVERALGIK